MNTHTVKIVGWCLIAIIVIAAALVLRGNDQAAQTGTATSSVTYALLTSKTVYAQNEDIGFIMLLRNTANTPQTFSFKDGCQVLYTIGNFDLAKNIRCIPGATSFTIAPGETKRLNAVHYASVYTLPVGSTTADVRVVGYGDVKAQIKITP